MTERQCLSLKRAAVRSAQALARRIARGEVIGPGEIAGFKELAECARWQPSALEDSKKLRELETRVVSLENRLAFRGTG